VRDAHLVQVRERVADVARCAERDLEAVSLGARGKWIERRASIWQTGTRAGQDAHPWDSALRSL